MMERFVWRILPILTFMGTISMEAEWKCATMVPTVQSVPRTGLTVMPELSVTTLVTVLIVSISMSLLDISQSSISQIGAEATGGMVFGLSDELPVLQNLMCNGSEYSLSYCPGYDLNNVTGEHCLSGDYQAGVRCIEGKNFLELITFFVYSL